MATENAKHVAVVLAAILCAANISLAKYSGGTGDPNNPYRIATPNDLNDVGNHVEDFNKCFVMVNDMNLADYNGTQFNIIGNWSSPFKGIFDGNGHAISNFMYECNDIDYIGVFGYIYHESAQIKNLTLIDANVRAGTGIHIGSLVGSLANGTVTNCRVEGGSISGGYPVGGVVGSGGSGLQAAIEDCYFTGEVSGVREVGGLVGGQGGTVLRCYSAGSVHATHIAGGLVGLNKGRISHCAFAGEVSGMSGVGGLVGINEHGTILNSYAIGTTDGNDYIGGLAGTNSQSIISDCYARGVVAACTGAGGLLGQHTNYGSASNCYAACRVDANSYAGGLVGVHSYGSYAKCFWDSDVNHDVNGIGNMDDPNVIGKTTVEMMTESTFTDAGWDFVEVWNIGENQTYPFLRTHPPGDLNHDGIVNFADVAILALHWLEGVE